MRFLTARYRFLFTSTKGLVLVGIALISLVTASLGTLSGPMEDLGVKSFLVRYLGLSLVEGEREGRIIILYHSIAMAVVAIETYLITAIVKMKESERVVINSTITFGYIVSMVFGLWFAYFGHNYIFHGLFIFGQALVFFAGVMLTKALWPWQKEYLTTDPERSRTKGGVDLERVAFFMMALSTLGSVIFGAVPGSLFGNGFQAFLAEDVIRLPEKTALELAIIGHLHIMLTEIAIALLLIIGRWFDFRGKLHQWAMPMVIIGTIIITAGVWSVVPYEPTAHIIINVGSTPMLVASLLLIIYGWRKIIQQRLAELKIQKPGFGSKIRALLHDPLRFGVLWQMLFMNFVVSFVGIFMAIRLDKVIRLWTLREERVALTGHWHVLAGIIATMILLYYADMAGLKGKVRQIFGWIVIVGSNIAFTAIAFLETKRLYVSELAQQTYVDTTLMFTDFGLVLVLVVLGALMFWRLIDLFRSKGRWEKEYTETKQETIQ